MALAAVDPLPRQTVDSAQLQRDMGPGAADISEIPPELSDKLEGIEKKQKPKKSIFSPQNNPILLNTHGKNATCLLKNNAYLK